MFWATQWFALSLHSKTVIGPSGVALLHVLHGSLYFLRPKNNDRICVSASGATDWRLVQGVTLPSPYASGSARLQQTPAT